MQQVPGGDFWHSKVDPKHEEFFSASSESPLNFLPGFHGSFPHGLHFSIFFFGIMATNFLPGWQTIEVARVNTSSLVLGPTFPTNPMVVAGCRG